MKRRLFLLLGALLGAGPLQAEPITLSALSAYINGLTTAETEFSQLNADGTASTGHLYIRRPGRMRFEYDPPEKALVLASGGQVAIFDAKSNTPPEQYPLKRTPLSLILTAKVDLSRANMIIGHYEAEGTTRLVAQDPEHPEYGTIELIFTADPVALRQWIVRDEAGSETIVTLGDLREGMRFAPGLFSIHNETTRRNPDSD